MGILKSVTVGVNASGSAGSASGNSNSPPFAGTIEAIEVNYHANTPATADLTITSRRSGVTIYGKANSTTDHFAMPRIYGVDAAGNALASNVTPERYCVDSGVNVAIAQANAETNAVIVTIHYRK